MSNNAMKTFLLLTDQLISEAGTIYHEYLAEGKTYGAAQRLWIINDKLYQHLQAGKPSASPEVASDIDAIIHHLHAWREKWLAHEGYLRPAPV